MNSCGTPKRYNAEEPVLFNSIDGQTFKIGKGMDKPLLLFFFATWCPGCKAMHDPFQEMINKTDRSKYDVVAVGREHTFQELKELSDSVTSNFKLAPDPNRDIFSQFADRDIPRVYLFDSNGNIVYQTIGWNEEKEGEILEALEGVLSVL